MNVMGVTTKPRTNTLYIQSPRIQTVVLTVVRTALSRISSSLQSAVSYTHLTLPTN